MKIRVVSAESVPIQLKVFEFCFYKLYKVRFIVEAK